MIEQVLVEYIANTLWQVPLLAAGAWILLRVITPEPRVQHWVWLTVLGLAVFLPMRGMGVEGAMPQSTVAHAQVRMAEQMAPAFPAAGSDVPRLERMPRLHSVHLAAAAVYWIVALYVSVTLLGLCRIVRAWWAARLLVERSRETVLCARSMACLEGYARRLGTTLPLTRESHEVKSPMIIGVADPVLLLPVGFDDLPEPEVKAVLCHELAHVKRRDYLVNSVCQVVALPVAWHPATYGIQRRISRTREMVCDAMAACEMESKIGYAKCLLALAREMAGGEGTTTQAAGLFGGNMLEERIMRLMETKTVLSARAKVARTASGVTAMVAAVAVAAMFHVVPAMAARDITPQLAAVQSEPVASQAPEAVVPAQAAQKKETVAAPPRANRVAKQPVVERSQGLAAEERHDAKKAINESREKKAVTNFDSAEFKKQMADAQREVEKINTPEFRAKITKMQQDALDARLNSTEFKKQMADAQREAEKFNTPEFRQKIAEMQLKALDARLNSAEFKKQMADAQREAEKFNTPEFRQKIAEMQQKALDARLNSAEFKKQMADAQREAEKVNNPEFKKQMAEMQEKVKAAMQSLKDQQEQDEGTQKNVK